MRWMRERDVHDSVRVRAVEKKLELNDNPVFLGACSTFSVKY